MAQLWIWILFIVPWQIGTAAADDGDDFANNLFTDLAPLLSLFGERVTMQFMSQALGFSDCVLLAVAPLGIVTLIVSAIRVGGPTWLKAIIGRARENLSVAELELMSSTSEEACELWNGRNIIRCQGSADIWQFICLIQPIPHGTASESGSIVDFRTLDQVMDVTGDGDGLMRRTSTSGPAYAFKMIQCRLSQLLNIKFKFNFPSQTSSGHGDEEMSSPSRHGSWTSEDTDHTAVRTRKQKKITIIGDSSSDGSAPNLALNCHDKVSREEMYLAATAGVLLQIGVLVFSGFITYYGPIRSSFKKEDEPVDGYAFPCAAVGTVILVLGMFICAVVVEQSTVETSLEAVEQGAELHIVWLQKNHVTNDQVFQPFAIYPRNRRQFIMTSRRRRTSSGKQGSGEFLLDKELPLLALEFLTVVGTLISLLGFCVQFVGLRGLNWAASVAQLSAVILMTISRAWVRRGLAQPPVSERVTPDFELDWFALSLADPATASWRRGGGPGSSDRRRSEGRDARNANRPATHWSVRSGRRKDYTQFAELEVVEEDEDEDERRMPAHDGNAQLVLDFRIQLGDIAVWRGPASEEAIRLTEALKIVAEALMPQASASSFTWILPVEIRREEEQGVDGGVISISLTRSSGRWKLEAGEIEAVMSLWMHSVHSRNWKRTKVYDARPKKGGDRLRSLVGQEPGLRLYGSCARRKQIERDLDWWMPETTTSLLSIQNLPQYIKRHDISEQRVVGLGVGGASDKPTTTATTATRTTGLSSINPSSDGLDDKDIACEVECPACKRNRHDDFDNTTAVEGHIGTLALHCDEPLEKLFSRDLMFSFIMAVAQLPRFSAPKATSRDHIDYHVSDKERRDLKLHNATLTNLVRDLEKAGYGDSSSLYFDLIVPLSIQQKLTDVGHLISAAQERAKEYELKRSWMKLADVCIWLLGLSRKLDSDRDRLNPLAVATCLDVLRKMNNAEILYTSEDVHDSRDLYRSKTKLLKEFCRTKFNHALHFFRLSKARRDVWATIDDEDDEEDKDLLKVALQISLESSDELQSVAFPESFGITTTHQVAMTDAAELLRSPLGGDILTEDSFGWTPMHYALEHGIFTVDKSLWFKLLDRYATVGIPSVTRVDFRGWTLLHYACQFSDLALVKHIVEYRGEDALTASGNDGVTPLHCAVKNPDSQIIEALTRAQRGGPFFVCESRGGPRLRDNNGRSLIHWAAMQNSLAWAEVAKHDVRLKDDFGLTALHLAALYGSQELLELLLKEDSSGKDELSGDEFSSSRFSPLHLAVSRRNNGAAGALIEAGANVNATDSEGGTPLHIAILGQNENCVQLLLANGADHNVTPRDQVLSPLQLALVEGNWEIVKMLADQDKKTSDKAVLFRDLNGNILHTLARHSQAYPAIAVRILEELLAISPYIDVNARDARGNTPLDLAYRHGRCPDLIRELKKRGAVGSERDDGESVS